MKSTARRFAETVREIKYLWQLEITKKIDPLPPWRGAQPEYIINGLMRRSHLLHNGMLLIHKTASAPKHTLNAINQLALRRDDTRVYKKPIRLARLQTL